MILEQDIYSSDCELFVSKIADKSSLVNRNIRIYIVLSESKSTQILHLNTDELSEFIEELLNLARNLPESIPF